MSQGGARERERERAEGKVQQCETVGRVVGEGGAARHKSQVSLVCVCEQECVSKSVCVCAFVGHAGAAGACGKVWGEAFKLHHREEGKGSVREWCGCKSGSRVGKRGPLGGHGCVFERNQGGLG